MTAGSTPYWKRRANKVQKRLADMYQHVGALDTLVVDASILDMLRDAQAEIDRLIKMIPQHKQRTK